MLTYNLKSKIITPKGPIETEVQYKLSYSILGMLCHYCEVTFGNKLPKNVKSKEAEKHLLLCEGLLTRLADYSDYIPTFDAYQIYFGTKEGDRNLGKSTL